MVACGGLPFSNCLMHIFSGSRFCLSMQPFTIGTQLLSIKSGIDIIIFFFIKNYFPWIIGRTIPFSIWLVSLFTKKVIKTHKNMSKNISLVIMIPYSDLLTNDIKYFYSHKFKIFTCLGYMVRLEKAGFIILQLHARWKDWLLLGTHSMYSISCLYQHFGYFGGLLTLQMQNFLL